MKKMILTVCCFLAMALAFFIIYPTWWGKAIGIVSLVYLGLVFAANRPAHKNAASKVHK